MVRRKIPNSMNEDANQDGAGWGVTGRRRQGISIASSPQFQRHLNTALPGHCGFSLGLRASVFIKPFLLQCILWDPTAGPAYQAVSHMCKGPGPRLVTQGGRKAQTATWH